MKRRRSYPIHPIDALRSRLAPGNALGRLASLMTTPFILPTTGESSPAALAGPAEVGPVVSAQPAAVIVPISDTAPVQETPVISEVDPSPVSSDSGSVAADTASAPVVALTTVSTTSTDDSGDVATADQPSSAESSGLSAPPVTAPTSSGAAASSTSSGAPIAVASNNETPTQIDTTPTDDDSPATNSQVVNISILASNGFLAGNVVTPDNDGSGIGLTPPTAGTVKGASAGPGLQSTGTRTSFTTAPDPGTAGTQPITMLDYEYGASAITLPDLVPTTTHTPAPVELDGEVTFPTDLSGGPQPSDHDHCMAGTARSTTRQTTNSASLSWPPTGTQLSIPSFQGYRFVADELASQGYIVVSIGANGINAVDNNTPDDGMKARVELIETQLNLWNTFDSEGEAPPSAADPNMFVGKINMQDIGEMGHSRGGEGVVEAYDYNKSFGSADPYGIKAVFALAPVDFQRLTDNNVPFAVMLPYADGDVSDLQGMHFFDDEEYNVSGDQSPKYEFLVMGADHDLFNTVWTAGLFPAGAADDWAGAERRRRPGSDPYAGTSCPANLRLLTRATAGR